MCVQNVQTLKKWIQLQLQWFDMMMVEFYYHVISNKMFRQFHGWVSNRAQLALLFMGGFANMMPTISGVC